MTDGDVSARPPVGDPGAGTSVVTVTDHLAGQAAIEQFFRAQDGAPRRSMIARIVGMSPLSAKAQPSYRAAIGEIAVGDLLASLGPNWTVLHSVPVGDDGAEIDHLVIGPAGVFIINTINHSGESVWVAQRTFMVGNIRQPHIRNMEYEMGRVERLLSTAAGRPVEVSGIVAVVDPKSLTVREAHRDVAVAASASLVPWLRSRTRTLSAEEITAISLVAREQETWHPHGAVTDPVAVRASFESVRSRVTRAWKLQIFWATAVTIIVAGGFMIVTYAILLGALGSFGI